MLTAGKLCSTAHLFSLFIASSMRIVARTPAIAWSGLLAGAPKMA